MLLPVGGRTKPDPVPADAACTLPTAAPTGPLPSAAAAPCHCEPCHHCRTTAAFHPSPRTCCLHHWASPAWRTQQQPRSDRPRSCMGAQVRCAATVRRPCQELLTICLRPCWCCCCGIGQTHSRCPNSWWTQQPAGPAEVWLVSLVPCAPVAAAAQPPAADFATTVAAPEATPAVEQAF